MSGKRLAGNNNQRKANGMNGPKQHSKERKLLHKKAADHLRYGRHNHAVRVVWAALIVEGDMLYVCRKENVLS